jgi:hypothetical protein
MFASAPLSVQLSPLATLWPHLEESPPSLISAGQSKAGWSWGCLATVDCRGRTTFVADAYRDDGKRFVVRADEKLTAFVEMESAICASRR